MPPATLWNLPIARRSKTLSPRFGRSTTMGFDRSFTRWCKALLLGTSDMTRRIAARRTFLKAAGVTLALPWLESTGSGAAAPAETPRRMVALCFALGLHGSNVIPKEAGADYAPTPYLDSLGQELRNELTVI